MFYQAIVLSLIEEPSRVCIYAHLFLLLSSRMSFDIIMPTTKYYPGLR